jgi:hypothetical protein
MNTDGKSPKELMAMIVSAGIAAACIAALLLLDV